MSIISALPSPARESETGSYRLSTVTASVDDGDEVSMDGAVATDDDGNVIAWANIPGQASGAGVSSGTDPSDLTVNHGAGAGTNVTVFALVE